MSAEHLLSPSPVRRFDRRTLLTTLVKPENTTAAGGIVAIGAGLVNAYFTNEQEDEIQERVEAATQVTYRSPTIPEDYPQVIENQQREEHNIPERNIASIGAMGVGVGLIFLSERLRKRKNRIKRENL